MSVEKIKVVPMLGDVVEHIETGTLGTVTGGALLGGDYDTLIKIADPETGAVGYVKLSEIRVVSRSVTGDLGDIMVFLTKHADVTAKVQSLTIQVNF